MAFTRTQGNAEYVTQGPLGIAGQFTDKRKYDLPGLITYQERSYALLDNILMNAVPTMTVTDPEPKLLARNEAPVKLNVKTDDTTTTLDGDTLKISDTQAKWLQAGDVLMCPQLFCDSDGANYTTTKYGSGYQPETMIVESVTESGIAAGVSSVIVKRGNGYTPASVTTILSEYKLIKMQNTIADGGNAPNPVDFEPLSEQNYVQHFSRVWGETSIQGSMDVYGKETMAQKGKRARREFFREIEWALFFGRKGKHQISGMNQYTTGGLVEYVPSATTSLDGDTRLIDFGGAYDQERMREICEIIYRYGNSMHRKDWFCGAQFFTALFNQLEQFITVNDQFSNRYGWKVQELELGHGTALLHRHPLFTDAHTGTGTGQQPYAKDAVVVDLEYLNLMIMANHNVQVRQNIQANRAHKREDEIHCVKGLYRRFKDAHAVVYGLTA